MMRSMTLTRPLRAAVALLAVLASCSSDGLLGTPTDGGMRPPYLAVIVFVDAPPGINSRGPYQFRVRELSGQLGVDTSFRASPKDTIIFHVKPASYRIDVSDVPTTCGVRNGTAQSIVVPENSNTSLVRFYITCSPALVVAAYTDGSNPDPDYVLTIRDSTGTETATVIPANDTVRFEGLRAGSYSVALRHVADNCLVISDGGDQLSVKVSATGGAFVPFRVVCSEEKRRPRVLNVVASYANGSIGYVIKANDPDGDIERSFVDITDCNRKSLLPAGGFRRGGFSGFPNVARKDTSTIIGGYDIATSDALFRNRCLAVWVADERGNHSPWMEIPIPARDPARAPTTTNFNARLNGIRGIQVAFTPIDPNQDYLGVFFAYLLRDGIISFPADGQYDRLVSRPPGILGNLIDELAVGIGYGVWSDYIGVVAYLVDRAGNVTRIEDLDLFR
jgi:hypothetical protein